jgi:lipopolysaccharide export LptBFGC system permease protein LptF
MKRIFIFLVLSVAIFSCNNNDASNTDSEKDSYEKNKESLREKEQKNPQNFLIISGNDKHNIVGQTVVKATISNKASVASYKDVDIQLDFYSKTGTLLETAKETVYEILNPGESKSFKTKYFAPKGTDSVALKILGAKIQ